MFEMTITFYLIIYSTGVLKMFKYYVWNDFSNLMPNLESRFSLYLTVHMARGIKVVPEDRLIHFR